MNTTDKDIEIVIDLNWQIESGSFDAYKERMHIVYDLADKVPDYCSIIVMDNGLIIRTIESRRKRQEESLNTIEQFKKFYCNYIGIKSF